MLAVEEKLMEIYSRCSQDFVHDSRGNTPESSATTTARNKDIP
jgi:hypothetical protein